MIVNVKNIVQHGEEGFFEGERTPVVVQNWINNVKNQCQQRWGLKKDFRRECEGVHCAAKLE